MFLDSDTEKRWLASKAETMRGLAFIPKDLLEVLEYVYSRQIEARDAVNVAIPAEADLAPADRNAAGAPLIPRDEFPIDGGAARALFEELLAWLGPRQDALGKAATVLGKELADGGLDLDRAFAAFLADDAAFFAPFSDKTPEAPMTLRFLVQASLTPSLEAVARSLDGRRDQERTWSFGHCPICGSMPFISQLKEKEGFRHLSCSFCRVSYRAKRVQCPFCGEDDQKKLTFYAAPEEPGYRVDVCATCKNYIKTADFRQLDKISLPLMDDVESMSLDILARQKGYKRPTLSGWGF